MSEHVSEHDLQDERRRNDTLVLALMQEIKDEVLSIRAELKTHVGEEINLFKQAFPGGDPHGHRAAHEAAIAAAKDKAQFWHDMRDHLAKWGLIGLASWLAYVVWVAFLKGPKP